ncbi:hypothetical protein J5N97_008204 [Dioscorea zingiberensis]|uniref:Uncharacterized protein n=1 Tax=Dioscorea zingiberensis TaxID=325984 RepID=A0A9D5DDF0_9LILI|nr:hypothetical protein J5N97_008204 [Dioscorea zingiberensis]
MGRGTYRGRQHGRYRGRSSDLRTTFNDHRQNKGHIQCHNCSETSQLFMAHMQGRLPTKEYMYMIRMGPQDVCPLCKLQDETLKPSLLCLQVGRAGMTRIKQQGHLLEWRNREQGLKNGAGLKADVKKNMETGMWVTVS